MDDPPGEKHRGEIKANSTIKHSKMMKTWIVVLFTAGMLFGNNLALGGEIHAAAMSGDIEKAKALLAGNPDLVFSCALTISR